jgi:hypothetical protein
MGQMCGFGLQMPHSGLQQNWPAGQIRGPHFSPGGGSMSQASRVQAIPKGAQRLQLALQQ